MRGWRFSGNRQSSATDQKQKIMFLGLCGAIHDRQGECIDVEISSFRVHHSKK